MLARALGFLPLPRFPLRLATGEVADESSYRALAMLADIDGLALPGYYKCVVSAV